MNNGLNRLLSWDNYSNVILRGLKIFLFYLTVLTLCRLIFILGLHDYIGASSGIWDILLAIKGGTKLSVQTAGLMMLVSLVPMLIFNLFSLKLEKKICKLTTGTVLTTLSILFVGSFPYYRQFHSRYHQILFNAGNDDVYALFISLVQEFYLPVRLAAALILAYVLYRFLHTYLDINISKIVYGILTMIIQALELPDRITKTAKWISRIVLLGVMYLMSLLIVFGGSLGWETAIDWENAGVTKDPFLNEVILDDFQAVYRGYRMNGRLLACNGLDFDVDTIRSLAGYLSGRPATSDDLDYYLRKNAQGPQLEKPRQVFLIISESYANWPLLDKYSGLHIADGMRGIIAGKDAAYCGAILPNGSSTVSAVTGIVSGLADANLYLTTMPESFKAPYPTAIAPQMKALGYETNFWYAGPATWERVGDFTKGQGFDSFYGRGDISSSSGSVWGCDDEELYREVLRRTPTDKATFNVILNVSNHSPYSVDVRAKGFDADKTKAGLPDNVKNDKDLLNELGHYWYADRELAKFVAELKNKYPDCLIMIVGDHADRYNIEKTPAMYERFAVPFVIIGKGVTKKLLPDNAAGSQIDIGPTLIEMIAPQGFEYLSIGQSLTRGNNRGVNYGYWITRDYIGEADKYPLEPIPIDEKAANRLPVDIASMQLYIDAVRSLSWWRPKYGAILDATLLEGRE